MPSGQHLPSFDPVERGDARLSGAFQPTRRSESSLFKLLSLAEQVRFVTRSRRDVVVPAMIPPLLSRDNASSSPRAAFSLAPNGADPVDIRLTSVVNRYARVPWWENAGLVVPIVVVTSLYGLLSILGRFLNVVWRAAHRGPRQRASLAHTLFNGELVLLLQITAILAAAVLVTIGAPAVALDSPMATWAVLLIYGMAWLGVVAVPMLFRNATRRWNNPDETRWARVHHTLMAFASLVLAVFCVHWKIAGLTLTL
jgi:hypothetical protein